MDETHGLKKMPIQFDIEDCCSSRMSHSRIASNWNRVIEAMIGVDAEKLIHSINDIFEKEKDETAAKAFSAFNILKGSQDMYSKITKLKKILMQLSEEESLLPLMISVQQNEMDENCKNLHFSETPP